MYRTANQMRKMMKCGGQGHRDKGGKVKWRVCTLNRESIAHKPGQIILKNCSTLLHPRHAGIGNGQAASFLAKIYKNVIATATSQKQLEFAPRLPNVQYKCTSPTTSAEKLERDIPKQATVDLVTTDQAIHWSDRPNFYQQVQLDLKKPRGVIAAWCYTTLQVNARVDAVFNKFYFVDSSAYWHASRSIVYEDV
ncbi:unnamed protein product [Coffea canephora]|uniref:Methyltransferase type 11 domain-containing protein n=1 Tax=Coffea canephora TaxID=49390 RepID=A0A068V0D7_COFCA|nr:unnamed protein product [Coffea canephora]